MVVLGLVLMLPAPPRPWDLASGGGGALDSFWGAGEFVEDGGWAIVSFVLVVVLRMIEVMTSGPSSLSRW